ncbi:VOC family protein [Cognatishimia sp. MH4019]|uniref:VOC family protein n=1 Tax=Cognatishimia sp. MH4019 TaxID=2854030 RepID=UPI001CD62289|nr:VOC family protein [Cognatishimia sp. MH4019]
MVKVLGIGGVFFRSKDPKALAEWYKTHLGIAHSPTDPDMMPWTTQAGVTIFSPFADDTDYFPADQSFMINFRVSDLDAAVQDLASAGVDSTDIMTMDGIGRFARIHDPEGRPIELWEPAQS